jgi:hypothetical protein
MVIKLLRGSHVYEVNTWLWNFGRPLLSVAKTEKICKRSWCRGAAAKSAWETVTRQAPNSALRLMQTYDMHIPVIYLSYPLEQ